MERNIRPIKANLPAILFTSRRLSHKDIGDIAGCSRHKADFCDKAFAPEFFTQRDKQAVRAVKNQATAFRCNRRNIVGNIGVVRSKIIAP